MTVTVLVPSYRRPEALRESLRGLSRADRLPDEVLVVLRDIDEQSQERLDEWRRSGEFGCLEERLRRVIATRPGQICAMNAGLVEATGDVVCFIDDDCVPRNDWLERLMRHYQDAEVGGVGGRDVVHHGETISAGQARRVGEVLWCGRLIGNHHLELISGPVEVDHLKGANMSFRRELMAHFDECLSGGSCCLNDTDASLHVKRQGYKLIYDPQVLVDHYPAERFGESTRVVTDPELVYSDSHNWVYCLFKHFGPIQRWLFLGYAFLVGGGSRHGLLKWLLALPRGPRAASVQLWASTRGKIAGVRTFYRRTRDQQVPD